MKFCFIINFADYVLCKRIAKLCERDHHECCYITWTPYDDRRMENLVDPAQIYSPYQYMQAHWDELDPDRLSEYQEKYSDVSLWDIFYSDRNIVTQPKAHAAKFLVGYCQFFELLFEKEHPDLIFCEDISSFTAFLAHYIGKHYKADYLGYSGDRFEANQSILFSRDDSIHLPLAEAKYISDHTFTPEQLEKTKKRISEIIKAQVVPSTKHAADCTQEPFWKDLEWYFRYLRKITVRNKAYNDFFDYTGYRQKKLGYQLLYLRTIRRKIANKYYELPKEGESYYFFPLHYQPEMSTLVASRKYVDQTFLIEQLAKSLPAGKMLYVKEHFVSHGTRTRQFLQSISQYPNVRVISPSANTYDLIQKSFAVIVLTSTVGFEALFYRKPLFVLGDIYYNILPCVTTIKDVYLEREKFSSPKPIVEEEVTRLMCAYWDSTYPGYNPSMMFYEASFTSLHKGNDPKNTIYNDDQNAQHVYQAILRELEERKKWKIDIKSM